jgi:flavodoxin
MNTLIVYDSLFGNTEQLAVAMARGLGVYGPSRGAHVNETPFTQLRDVDLLILGCPTQQWNLTPDMKVWLERAPVEALRGPRVACFDTRLRIALWIGRRAAPLMARSLRRRGIALAASPEGFFVSDRDRRLETGEVARGVAWAMELGEMLAESSMAEPAPGATES